MPREKRIRTIPIAPLDQLIRRTGIDRVSESAAIELGSVLEEIGMEIANRARELSEHAGRKTMTDSDIRLAYTQWKRRH